MTLAGEYLEEYLFQTDWVELSVNVNTPRELELARSYFQDGDASIRQRIRDDAEGRDEII